jgi:hypothetical protein
MAEDDPVFAPPGTRRLCVMRDGHAVVRDWQIPNPTVLVDTRGGGMADRENRK